MNNLLHVYERHDTWKKTTSLWLSLMVCFILSLAGCGLQTIGYGVILWAENDSVLVNGDIVRISAISRIQKSYIVHKDDVDKGIPIITWRVEFFSTYQEAEEFAQKFRPYAHLYAYSDKDGTPPVREEPLNSKTVRIISKPKAYQVLKVVGRTEEKTKIGNMEDYWYYILIEYQGIGRAGNYETLGEKGYCFGHYLNIIATGDDPEKEIEKKQSETNEDELLTALLSTTWRPSYFLDMIVTGRIDLSRFNSSMGLFPEPGVNRITIETPDGVYKFDYSGIIRVRSNLFSFTDADLRIEVLSDARISATYTAYGKQVNEMYVKIKTDIDELCAREKTLRKAFYNDFYIRGKVLSSSAYGVITLDENQGFSWKGFERLAPSIIPRTAQGSGNVDFPFFIAKDLKDQYDGIITFYFKGYKSEKGISFLYKFTDQGVRFVSLHEDYIIEREVTRTGINPIIMFFTFSGM
jgi:hypothetical protein